MDKIHTKHAVGIFDKYAQGYQTKYMDVNMYYKSLDLFCSLLSKKSAKILELACGPGNITKYLLTQNSDLDILATDLSPAMLKLAKENNPNASVQLLDCRAILKTNASYDAIICGFGLPYVSKEDAVKMIADAYASLDKGGLLYLSTMEDDYSKSGFQTSSSNAKERLFMYFHEAKYIEAAFVDNGFHIVDISRIKYDNNKGEDVTDLIVIGKK